MNKDTRLNFGPSALLLIVVAVLVLLAVRKRLTTAEEVEKAVAKVEYHAVRDSHSPFAILAVAALVAFVVWTVVRANRGGNATPPAKESSASEDRTRGSGVSSDNQHPPA